MNKLFKSILVAVISSFIIATAAIAAPSNSSSQLRLKDYGAALDCATPDDAALQQAIIDAQNLTYGTNRIGWSGCLYVTQSIILGRVVLEGDEILTSTIRKGFAGGILIRLNACGGSTLRNFSVPSNSYTPNSYIIYSSATNNPPCAVDRLVLENLYLSSGYVYNAPFRNIELNGSGRIPPNATGIREPIIRNITAFGATGGNIYFDGLQAADISGLHTYSFGAGTGTDGHVYMNSTTFTGQDNHMMALDIEGTLYVQGQSLMVASGNIQSIHWGSSPGGIRVIAPNGPVQSGAIPPNTGVW